MKHRNLLALLAVLLVGACDSGGGGAAPVPATLLPVADAEVVVGATLQVALAVDNPEGLALSYTFEGPPLPGLDSVAHIGGSPAGGTFTWTPLVSHVGTHVFTFRVRSEAGEDSRAAVLTVTAGQDSAPVFLSPGAGTTLDLARTPCLSSAVEVSDADSESVTLSLEGEAPEGCALTQEGPKSGTLRWCPSAQQVDRALRWTLTLRADDGEHAAVRHVFRVVLQRPVEVGCEGEPPTVAFVAPAKGEALVSAPGFAVIVEASDDNPLKDAPLLYYRFEAPADEEAPDLSTFSLAVFSRGGAEDWTARIPDPGLAPGEQRVVYLVAEVTDNDDEEGTACDHTTRSELHRFVAVGAGEAPRLADCAPCARDAECASGLCVVDGEGGAWCLPGCDAGCGRGSCAYFATVDGLVAELCGPPLDFCFNLPECLPDAWEPNDGDELAVIESGDVVEGRICPGDEDWFLFEGTEGDELSLLLVFDYAASDLDLDLYDAEGLLLARSDGVEDEGIEGPLPATDLYLVRVYGYEGDTGDYLLELLLQPGVE